MVEIKKLIKSDKAVLCFVAFLLILTVFGVGVINQNESFSPSASHIVLSKWFGDNKRRADITFNDIDEEMLVQAKLGRIPYSQTKLIFKTNNLRFSLFTNGKMIYKNTDKKYEGYGKHIHIIDIRDLKKGDELYLFLSPVTGATGRIESDVYLTTKNDYIFELLCKNQKTIAVLSAFSAAAITLIIIGIMWLWGKKKTAPKALYLSCCMIISGLIILLKSDLAQFVLNNGVIAYLLLYSSCSLLGVFVCAFMNSVLKIKNRITVIYDVLVIVYTVLRAVLFFVFSVPLGNFLFVSHIMIFVGITLPIIQFLRMKKGDS